jgi:CDP-diacylglycerol--glycerol-3-phosphate 3-phosphatidyltransferase
MSSATQGAISGQARQGRETSARAWIPNALTMARVVMAVVFFVMLAVWPHMGRAPGDATGPGVDVWLNWAWPLFIVAAFTDVLDGYLARRWNVITRFGRIMDPFADKVLVLGAFILLAGPAFERVAEDGARYQLSGVAPWMVVVMLSRELLVTSIRGVLEADGVQFGADVIGKVKMFVQSTTVPIILGIISIFGGLPGSTGHGVILGFVWATVIITSLSGVPYCWRAVRTSARTSAGKRA